jgi:eukaryotic-like serine/threonine-protein kinase
MSDTDSATPPKRIIEIDYTGKRLGDYQVLRRLGRGAMAEVYLAEQTALGRQVALKILKPELAEDATYVKRFQHEARAAASLTHANIVQIYDVGQQSGAYYIAQEYVAGQNLRDLLQRKGSLDLRMALSILKQTSAALHKANERGIVHRDIKPENLLLTREGEVKVADFGLARLSSINQSQALALTQIGVTMGTPLYMSPEQVEGKQLDARSDLYSLGVTLYHLLAGQPPFRGDNALSVAVQHLKTPPDRLEHIRPDLPAGLCRIVHRLLAKNPSERYASAQALLLEVRALYREFAHEDWSDEGQDWGSTELTALADARVEATHQLDELMKTQTLLVQQQSLDRRWWWGVAAAFLCGAILSFAMRRPDPLRKLENGLGIDRQKSASEQYAYASFYNQGRSIEAWQSIKEYFPTEKEYIDLAQIELAWLYLNRKDYTAALPIYRELSLRSEESNRLNGLAGQAIIFDARAEQDDFNRTWADFQKRKSDLKTLKKEIKDYIKKPEMLNMLNEIERKLKPA